MAGDWLLALIGLAGVAVGAVLTALGQYWVQRTVRRRAAERAAVTAFGDAALALRDAARRAGDDPFSASRALVLDSALGRFDLMVERVVSVEVRDRAAEWRPIALRYFSGDEDVSRWQEEGAWVRLAVGTGVSLREHY